MRCREFQSAVTTSSFAAMTLMLTSVAMAEEPKTAVVTQHQMAHCLIQRIHEDRRGARTESYKDAFRACKQDLAGEADRATPTALTAANDVEASK